MARGRRGRSRGLGASPGVHPGVRSGLQQIDAPERAGQALGFRRASLL